MIAYWFLALSIGAGQAIFSEELNSFVQPTECSQLEKTLDGVSSTNVPGENQYSLKNSLSPDEVEIFIKTIRLTLKELGFSEWETFPIEIQNGSQATAWKHKLAFGSEFFKNPQWLKAVAGHELIHIEKNHSIANAVIAYCGLFSTAVLLSIFKSCYYSKRAGLWLAIKSYIGLAMISPFIYLLARNQEHEADILSVTRWGTAQELLEYLLCRLNRNRAKKLTIDEIVQKNDWRESVKNIFFNKLHPSEIQRISYLHEIAQKQRECIEKVLTDKDKEEL